jgi:hypothetical protein
VKEEEARELKISGFAEEKCEDVNETVRSRGESYEFLCGLGLAVMERRGGEQSRAELTLAGRCRPVQQ